MRRGWRQPGAPAIISGTVTFRLLGIPLRVRWSFAIVILLLGMPLIRTISHHPLLMLERLGIWLAVAGVSVVVHELGHALLARRFGATVTMELWALGGLTSWRPGQRPITPARRAAIAAAGSALGMVVGAVAFPLWKLAGAGPAPIQLGLGWMVWVNLGWGLINWLPIRLLDGGHIFRALFDMIWPKRSERIANLFFLCSSAGIALVAFRIGFPIVSLFAVIMLIMEVRFLPNRKPKPRPPVSPPPTGHFLLGTSPPSEPGDPRDD